MEDLLAMAETKKMNKTLENINSNLATIARILDHGLPAIEKAIRACARD